MPTVRRDFLTVRRSNDWVNAIFTGRKGPRVQQGSSRNSVASNPERVTVMGSFKPDFYRFFAIGFAVGALFVGATMDIGLGSTISDGVIPVAEAQVAQ
jgi:hypothetical protein